MFHVKQSLGAHDGSALFATAQGGSISFTAAHCAAAHCAGKRVEEYGMMGGAMLQVDRLRLVKYRLADRD